VIYRRGVVIVYVLIIVSLTLGVAWNRTVLSLIKPKLIPPDGWVDYENWDIGSYTAGQLVVNSTVTPWYRGEDE